MFIMPQWSVAVYLIILFVLQVASDGLQMYTGVSQDSVFHSEDCDAVQQDSPLQGNRYELLSENYNKIYSQ